MYIRIENTVKVLYNKIGYISEIFSTGRNEQYEKNQNRVYPHGNHDTLKDTFATIREAIAESGKNVAILLDTKGPEVRVTTFRDGSVVLGEGAEFTLFKNRDEGDVDGVAVSYPKLIDLFFNEGAQAIGRELLLDDGMISLIVQEVRPDCIICRVNKGGELKNRKSLNIPGYHISMPYVSAQDRRDIEFGLSQGANVVAASFVRNHEDVRTLRDFIDSIGYEHVEIIAKIENQSGVDDMDEIINYAWALKFRLSSSPKSRKHLSASALQRENM